MASSLRLLLAVSLAAAVPAIRSSAADAPRDPSFWREIAARKFAPPAGADADALAWELTGFLGSPDPEKRDAFGYEITAAWLRERRLSAAAQQRLLARWRAGLARTGADDAAVLERAFSALNLSTLIAFDNRDGALAAEEIRGVLAEALAVFAAETDPRGYDAALGWVHAMAHEADLLKFLARSRHVGAPELGRILEAVAARAEASAQPWVWGEDERLAAVVLSVARRPEGDVAALAAFVTRLAKLPEGYVGVRVDAPVYHRARNASNLLRVLHLSLAAGKGPRDAELAAAVLAALRG